MLRDDRKFEYILYVFFKSILQDNARTDDNTCLLIVRERAVASVQCDMLKSLWPSDVIWRRGSRSTLAQVMSCCLTAQSLTAPEPMLTIDQRGVVAFI